MIGKNSKVISIPVLKDKEQHRVEMLDKYKNIIVKPQLIDDVLNSEINMIMSGKQKDIAGGD